MALIAVVWCCVGRARVPYPQYMQNQQLATWHQPPNRFIFPPGTDFMEQNSFYYPNYNSINMLVRFSRGSGPLPL